MDVQVILREGQPEYAVLPWAQYQALLKAAGQELAAPVKAETAVSINPGFQALRQLREARGLSLEQCAERYATASLPESQAGWRWHEQLGFNKKEAS